MLTDKARPAIIIIVAASKRKTKELAGDDDIDAWLSLVERCVRDAEAAGSNPVASTLAEILRLRVSAFLCV